MKLVFHFYAFWQGISLPTEQLSVSQGGLCSAELGMSCPSFLYSELCLKKILNEA
jgi:hypothetical protein